MRLLGECIAQLVKAEAVAKPGALEHVRPRLALLTGAGLPSTDQASE